MYKRQEEFGMYGYTVPHWVQILVDRGILHDTSWHNDTMPTFEPDEENSGVRLWIDHVNPDERECQTARFGLTIADMCGDNSETAYEGDDAGILSEVLFKTDYDPMTTFYYVRLIGGTKKIETGFDDEVSAIMWIADFIKRNVREV